MFQTGVILVVVATCVVAIVVGVVAAKRLSRSRQADLMEVLGQKDLARELRSYEPVTPYYQIAALIGALVGLISSAVGIGFMVFAGLDLFTYRIASLHLIWIIAVVGLVIAGLAGWIVARRS